MNQSVNSLSDDGWRLTDGERRKSYEAVELARLPADEMPLDLAGGQTASKASRWAGSGAAPSSAEVVALLTT